MSFRARLTLAAALAVALAIALTAPAVYAIVRGELRGQVDSALRARAATIARRPLIKFTDENGYVRVQLPHEPPGGSAGYVQYVSNTGDVGRPEGEPYALRIGRARDVAAGKLGHEFFDTRLAGKHVRVLTVPTVSSGVAVQVARDLSEVDSALGRIRTLIFLLVLGGIGLATILGLVVARAALAPVRRLTAASEHVATTRDLTSRIEDRGGSDELARLASSFNTMLAALEESSLAQRQLVSDASHELRTPLTSLRTNIEVLARDESMAPEEREALLRDVTEQLAEMTALIAELVELARGDRHPDEPEDVRLDLITADAIERAERNRPSVSIKSELQATTVHGAARTIERAISNLLDNAAKWSPPGGEVEVCVKDGEVTVRDHGSGIAESDLPFVFDRFYRAPSARGKPGSGLGLAIVRQVAEAHGGTVVAERAEGGGTLLRLSFSRDGGARPTQ
jgi:two-component system, OmpR family, sensor histidine kinase MprB